MAESGLDSLQQTHAVQVEWRAFELRPAGAPPISPDYRQRILEGWPRVQQIARERFNVELTHPGLKNPGDTRLAHIGAKYAIEQGRGEAYHRAVFRAHWQAQRDIAAVDVLVEIAGEIGLAPEAFRAALADENLISAVEADVYWAYQQGLSGVPAFIFGSRYLVSGAQPVEVLRQVAERCLAEGLVE
jgi:predicted DsbA family dithiol-disulfide isomerase